MSELFTLNVESRTAATLHQALTAHVEQHRMCACERFRHCVFDGNEWPCPWKEAIGTVAALTKRVR